MSAEYDRRTLLLVMQELAQTPNQSARSLSVRIFDEGRTRSRERGRVTRVLGVLFDLGLLVVSGQEAVGTIMARCYSLARGVGPRTIELALAQDLSFWQALLRTSDLEAWDEFGGDA